MAEKYVLDSGMSLVMEYMPQLRSVSAGLWINAGSAYEESEQAGISHFLEHLLFKGTQKRSAMDIAAAMESVGGVLNAFTSRENTCYYTRALDEHFELCLELLSDMYHNSLIESVEVEREKNVIIEEINMYEDSPDEVAVDLFNATLWPDHSYGRSVAGSIETVGCINRDSIAEYWQQNYCPGNTVLSIAGNVKPEQAIGLAETLFARDPGHKNKSLEAPINRAGDSTAIKDIEQNHICLGFPGVSLQDPDYYPAAIIVNALGGGASSRLFQEVREKRGLSYSVFAYLETLNKAGHVMAYSSTRPENSKELIEVIVDQFAVLKEKGLTDEEMKRSKDQLKGNLLLSQENSSNVMSQLGKTELAFGRPHTAAERVEKLLLVTREDIERVTARIFCPGTMVLTQVGPRPCQAEAGRLFS